MERKQKPVVQKAVFVGRILFKVVGRVGRIKVLKLGCETEAKDQG